MAPNAPVPTPLNVIPPPPPPERGALPPPPELLADEPPPPELRGADEPPPELRGADEPEPVLLPVEDPVLGEVAGLTGAAGADVVVVADEEVVTLAVGAVVEDVVAAVGTGVADVEPVVGIGVADVVLAVVVDAEGTAGTDVDGAVTPFMVTSGAPIEPYLGFITPPPYLISPMSATFAELTGPFSVIVVPGCAATRSIFNDPRGPPGPRPNAVTTPLKVLTSL